MSYSRLPEPAPRPQPRPRPGPINAAAVRDGHPRPDRALAVTSPLLLTTIPSACRIARWHAKDVLRSWGLTDELEWQTVQVISELVGNCCSHAAPAAKDTPPVFSLTLRLFHDALCVEVFDSSPERPVLREPDGDDESGRGLRIVTALCLRIKILATPPGKTVVAVIPRGSRRPT